MDRKLSPALCALGLLVGSAPAASAAGDDLVAAYSVRLSRQDRALLDRAFERGHTP